MRGDFHVRFCERLGVRFPGATRLVVLGKGKAEEMYKAVEGIMRKLKLVINTEKTQCLRSPEEPFEFLGYRIGRNYRPTTGQGYIGTRPSNGSVQSVCRKISELTEARYGLLEEEEMVRRVNRVTNGWGNYFHLGQARPAYVAVDRHAIRRLRQWLCRKHKMKAGKYARYPDGRLWGEMGLIRLAVRPSSYPRAKA